MKLEQSLTGWFKPEIKPVHIGVYQIKDGTFDEDEWYSFWDGFKWCYTTRSVNAAFDDRLLRTDLNQKQHWRGLAKKP